MTTARDKFHYTRTLCCLIKALEGVYTELELRNESHVKGIIETVSGSMGVTMRDCELIVAGRATRLQRFFVQGRKVRMVAIPDDINMIDAMQGIIDMYNMPTKGRNEFKKQWRGSKRRSRPFGGGFGRGHDRGRGRARGMIATGGPGRGYGPPNRGGRGSGLNFPSRTFPPRMAQPRQSNHSVVGPAGGGVTGRGLSLNYPTRPFPPRMGHPSQSNHSVVGATGGFGMLSHSDSDPSYFMENSGTISSETGLCEHSAFSTGNYSRLMSNPFTSLQHSSRIGWDQTNQREHSVSVTDDVVSEVENVTLTQKAVDLSKSRSQTQTNSQSQSHDLSASVGHAKSAASHTHSNKDREKSKFSSRDLHCKLDQTNSQSKSYALSASTGSAKPAASDSNKDRRESRYNSRDLHRRLDQTNSQSQSHTLSASIGSTKPAASGSNKDLRRKSKISSRDRHHKLDETNSQSQSHALSASIGSAKPAASDTDSNNDRRESKISSIDLRHKLDRHRHGRSTPHEGIGSEQRPFSMSRSSDERCEFHGKSSSRSMEAADYCRADRTKKHIAIGADLKQHTFHEHQSMVDSDKSSGSPPQRHSFSVTQRMSSDECYEYEYESDRHSEKNRRKVYEYEDVRKRSISSDSRSSRRAAASGGDLEYNRSSRHSLDKYSTSRSEKDDSRLRKEQSRSSKDQWRSRKEYPEDQ